MIGPSRSEYRSALEASEGSRSVRGVFHPVGDQVHGFAFHANEAVPVQRLAYIAREVLLPLTMISLLTGAWVNPRRMVGTS